MYIIPKLAVQCATLWNHYGTLYGSVMERCGALRGVTEPLQNVAEALRSVTEASRNVTESLRSVAEPS